MPLVWIVFRQLRLNASARIIAVALLMINDYQVFHARYVRMYALFFLLSLGSMALFNLFLERATPRRTIALTAVNLLLVYTQYFGWMVVGIEALHLLLMDRRKLKPFLLGAAAIALLFAPWAYAAAQSAIAKGGLAPNLGWIRHPENRRCVVVLRGLQWPALADSGGVGHRFFPVRRHGGRTLARLPLHARSFANQPPHVRLAAGFPAPLHGVLSK